MVQLEKELSTLRNSLESLSAERSGIQSGSFDFRRRLQAAKHDVTQAETELKSYEDDISSFHKKLVEVTADEASLSAEETNLAS